MRQQTSWAKVFLLFLGTLGLPQLGYADAPRIEVATLERSVLRPGEAVAVTYHWSGASLDSDYRVFVHVVDQDGNIRFQNDHAPAVPTSQWSGFVRYSESLAIPSSAADGDYRILAGLYSPGGPRLTLVPGAGVADVGSRRYQIGTLSLRTQATALTAKLSEGTVNRGDPLAVTYRWQSTPLATDYRVFVHFVDQQDNIRFQNDHAPPLPTSQWTGAISYTNSLSVPSGLPEGEYRILAGLYSPGEPRAALFAGPDVEYAGRGRYQIGRLQVSDDPLPVINVTELEVFPDDGVDDTVKIQEAIDDMAGGTLVFPPGNYEHIGVIRVKGNGLRLKGYGATLTSTNPELQAVYVEGRDIELLGFYLAASAAATERGSGFNYAAIAVTYSENITIADNHIIGSSASGIIISRDTTNYVVRYNRVENTLADGIHNTGGANGGWIVGNTTVNTADDGIAMVSYIANDAYTNDIHILNNKVLGNTHGRGITVVGGTNVEIVGNLVENTNGAGILITSESSYQTYAAKNVTVTGNLIRNANSGSTAPDHGGIFIYGRDGMATVGGLPVTLENEDILVRGNTISDTILGPGHIRLGKPYNLRINLIDNVITDVDSSKPGIVIKGGMLINQYNAVNNTYNGAPLPDHIGDVMSLPE